MEERNKHPYGLTPALHKLETGQSIEHFKSPINGDSTLHYLRIKEEFFDNLKDRLLEEEYEWYDGNESCNLYVNPAGKGITVLLDRNKEL